MIKLTTGSKSSCFSLTIPGKLFDSLQGMLLVEVIKNKLFLKRFCKRHKALGKRQHKLCIEMLCTYINMYILLYATMPHVYIILNICMLIYVNSVCFRNKFQILIIIKLM